MRPLAWAENLPATNLNACPALVLLPERGKTGRVVEPSSDPAPFISAPLFVDTWIAPPRKPAPVVRDFSFKAIMGEPEW